MNEPLMVPGQWVLHSCSSDLCTDVEVFWIWSWHLNCRLWFSGMLCFVPSRVERL